MNYEVKEEKEEERWYLDDSAHYLYLLAALVILLAIYIGGDDNLVIVELLICTHFLLLMLKFTCNGCFMRFFFGVSQKATKAKIDDVEPTQTIGFNARRREQSNTQVRKIKSELKDFEERTVERNRRSQAQSGENSKYQGRHEQDYLRQSTIYNHSGPSSADNPITAYFPSSVQRESLKSIYYRGSNNMQRDQDRGLSQRYNDNYRAGYDSSAYYSPHATVQRGSYRSQSRYFGNLLPYASNKPQEVLASKYAPLPQHSKYNSRISIATDNYVSRPSTSYLPWQELEGNVQLAYKQFQNHGITKAKAQKMINYLRKYYRTELDKYRKQEEQRMSRIDRLCIELFGGRLSYDQIELLRILRQIVTKFNQNKQIPGEYFSKPLELIDKQYFSTKLNELKNELDKINDGLLSCKTKRQLLRFYVSETEARILPGIKIKPIFFEYYNAGFVFKEIRERCYGVAYDMERQFSYVSKEQINHSYNLQQTMLLVILGTRGKVHSFGSEVLSKLESL